MAEKHKPVQRQVIGRGYEPGGLDLSKLPPVKDFGPGAGADKKAADEAAPSEATTGR